ncbi:MAG: hypothetical protein ABIN48_09430 [Ginsengibacter sp.]
MSKVTKRFIFFFSIGILLIAVIVTYNIWNQHHEDIQNAEARSMTAVQLYKSLSEGSEEIKSILINQVINVSGEINQVIKNQKGQQVILLKTGTSGGSVNCTMEEEVMNIKEGDVVILKGVCIGYISGDPEIDLPGDVFLIRCYRSS